MDSAQLLVVDDDSLVRESMSAYLSEEGYSVFTADGLGEAQRVLQKYEVHVALVDVCLNEDSGFELLRSLQERKHPPSVIMCTAYSRISDAVKAIKMGAFDYVSKPADDEEVRLKVQRALNQQKRLEQNNGPGEQPNVDLEFEGFVCEDPSMRRALKMIRIVARSGSTVLLTGESGTGKTLVARAIHQNSPRAEGPFIEVNCGCMADTLLESELFGHVRGAFSGAVADKEGKFQVADGGTIFLDEVALASPGLQMKLLRVLESLRFEPVGSNETRKVDVRVVLATNEDLGQMVEQGDFREDLYYRINVMDIHLPPLRRREADILPLARHFIEKYRHRALRDIQGISREAERVLTAYRWPGNVRELENVMHKAVVFCEDDRIQPENLDCDAGRTHEGVSAGGEVLPLKESVKKTERRVIIRALKECDDNRKMAAELLDINRTTLYNKLHEHDLMDASC